MMSWELAGLAPVSPADRSHFRARCFRQISTRISAALTKDTALCISGAPPFPASTYSAHNSYDAGSPGPYTPTTPSTPFYFPLLSPLLPLSLFPFHPSLDHFWSRLIWTELPRKFLSDMIKTSVIITCSSCAGGRVRTFAPNHLSYFRLDFWFHRFECIVCDPSWPALDAFLSAMDWKVRCRRALNFAGMRVSVFKPRVCGWWI